MQINLISKRPCETIVEFSGLVAWRGLPQAVLTLRSGMADLLGADLEAGRLSPLMARPRLRPTHRTNSLPHYKFAPTQVECSMQHS